MNFLNQYITIGNKYDINFVLDKIYEAKQNEYKKIYIEECGIKYSVNVDSHRYFTFARNTNCYICNLPSSYFLLQQSKYDKTSNQFAAHFNLYAEDINNSHNGNIILMTADHVIPVSKNGKSNSSNLKTCCYFCNNKKGNKI